MNSLLAAMRHIPLTTPVWGSQFSRTSGFGAELMSVVQENGFYHLEAPVERVTGWDTPYPHAQEWDYFPGPRRVGEALKHAMEA